jgi:predicted nucleic acid-binding protein
MTSVPPANIDEAIPKLVLDTNAVLDWLVFDNPSCQTVTTAILSGSVSWIVNDAVRDELAHVLGRGVVDRWAPDLLRLWQVWERHSTPTGLPSGLSPLHRPRCTDTDDQKFIDLALDTGAHWLITRDRALLKLARRAIPLKLAIVTPERFDPDATFITR